MPKKFLHLKIKLPQKLTDQTKRSNVTQYICSLGSRQEFEPLIGILCEKEIVEPLHLKNNAVQKLHNQMLLLVLADSNLPNRITSMTDMPNCSMKRYLYAP